MKPTIYVAKKLPREVITFLEEHATVREWTAEEPITCEVLKQELQDAEGLLLMGTPITEEVLDAAPQLKAVSTVSVGYNHLQLDALQSRGIIGTHTPYVLDETVADLAFTLILAAGRRVVELDTMVRAGEWQKGKDELLYGMDIHHSTLGIIGMGRIGEQIARRAKLGFEMNVLYHNRTRKLDVEENLGVAYASMETLLAESDYVLLMLPLTDTTRGSFGAQQFDQMKRTAVFVNVARGPIVDQQALTEALQQGKIFAAGLDVYEKEPADSNDPLLQCKNLVALPHIGSATHATRLRMAMRAAHNLVNVLQGNHKDADVIPETR